MNTKLFHKMTFDLRCNLNQVVICWKKVVEDKLLFSSENVRQISSLTLHACIFKILKDIIMKIDMDKLHKITKLFYKMTFDLRVHLNHTLIHWKKVVEDKSLFSSENVCKISFWLYTPVSSKPLKIVSWKLIWINFIILPNYFIKQLLTSDVI